jgi:LysR family transcriptional activator of nhaA
MTALLTNAPLILPTPETALRAGFDAMIERMGIVPRIAAEADDMAMLRLLARSDAGVAVIPPIVVRDELAAGTLYELFQLPDIAEIFYAVTIKRTFPNPLLQDVLGHDAPETEPA